MLSAESISPENFPPYVGFVNSVGGVPPFFAGNPPPQRKKRIYIKGCAYHP